MEPEIQKILKNLKSSSDFKDYLRHNKDCYLASCFKMGDEKIAESPWQFDFFSLTTKKMTSFQVGSTIRMQKDQEVFGTGNSPEELDLKNVNIGFSQVMQNINQYAKKSLPGESITKNIVILQHLNGKSVWNVTLLTSAFNVINLRLDASNGHLMTETRESIFSFKLK